MIGKYNVVYFALLISLVVLAYNLVVLNQFT
jgi:hypothetical protein